MVMLHKFFNRLQCETVVDPKDCNQEYMVISFQEI